MNQPAQKPTINEAAVKILKEQAAKLKEPLQLLDTDSFITRMDNMRDELVLERSETEKLIGSSLTVSAGLSVGYVVWLARSGIIMSSVLSSLPAWRFIDPLPVLSTLGAMADQEDDESLESMVAESEEETTGDETRD